VFKDENIFPKVVYVISLPFELRDGDNLPDYMRNYEEGFFNSWTQQDLLDAVQALHKAGYLHAAITNDIADFRARHANGLDDDDADGFDKKLNAKADNVPISMSSIHSYVDFKYFYAGGSIRFMLDYILDRLKAKLSILIDSVMTNHHSKAFASQAILYGTNDTTYSLMQRFTNERGGVTWTPVSRYVASKTVMRVQDGLYTLKVGRVEIRTQRRDHVQS